MRGLAVDGSFCSFLDGPAPVTMEVDPAVEDGMMEYGEEDGGYYEEGGYEGDIDDLPVTQEDAWAVIR